MDNVEEINLIKEDLEEYQAACKAHKEKNEFDTFKRLIIALARLDFILPYLNFNKVEDEGKISFAPIYLTNVINNERVRCIPILLSVKHMNELVEKFKIENEDKKPIEFMKVKFEDLVFNYDFNEKNDSLGFILEPLHESILLTKSLLLKLRDGFLNNKPKAETSENK